MKILTGVVLVVTLLGWVICAGAADPQEDSDASAGLVSNPAARVLEPETSQAACVLPAELGMNGCWNVGSKTWQAAGQQEAVVLAGSAGSLVPSVGEKKRTPKPAPPPEKKKDESSGSDDDDDEDSSCSDACAEAIMDALVESICGGDDEESETLVVSPVVPAPVVPVVPVEPAPPDFVAFTGLISPLDPTTQEVEAWDMAGGAAAQAKAVLVIPRRSRIKVTQRRVVDGQSWLWVHWLEAPPEAEPAYGWVLESDVHRLIDVPTEPEQQVSPPAGPAPAPAEPQPSEPAPSPADSLSFESRPSPTAPSPVPPVPPPPSPESRPSEALPSSQVTPAPAPQPPPWKPLPSEPLPSRQEHPLLLQPEWQVMADVSAVWLAGGHVEDEYKSAGVHVGLWLRHAIGSGDFKMFQTGLGITYAGANGDPLYDYETPTLIDCPVDSRIDILGIVVPFGQTLWQHQGKSYFLWSVGPGIFRVHETAEIDFSEMDDGEVVRTGRRTDSMTGWRGGVDVKIGMKGVAWQTIAIGANGGIGLIRWKPHQVQSMTLDWLDMNWLIRGYFGVSVGYTVP